VLAETEKDPHRLILHTERIILPLLRAVLSPMEREHFVSVISRATGSTPEAIREGLRRLPKGESGRAPEAAKGPSFEHDSDEVLLRAVVASYPETPLARRVQNEYARITGRSIEGEESPERVLFETGILYGEAPAEHAADDTLKRFEKAELSRAYEDALAALRQAESAGDEAAIRSAEAACDTVRKAIAAL
jgi:hypothetical protein